MTDCNEAAQMEINALVVTVGSGGVQTMDTLVGEAVWKENLFFYQRADNHRARAIHTGDILRNCFFS